MIFGNEKTSAPIDAWGIDAIVAAKVADVLKARFRVVPMQLSKEGQSALASAPGYLFGDRDGYICSLLRKQFPGQQVNYYLRVHASERNFANTNQVIGGLGIVHREGFNTGYTYVHALFWIEVLDGATCKSLRSQDPPYKGGNLLTGTNVPGPNLEVEPSWMPNSQTAARDSRLKEATRSLVEQALAQTLPILFSTGASQ